MTTQSNSWPKHSPRDTLPCGFLSWTHPQDWELGSWACSWTTASFKPFLPSSCGYAEAHLPQLCHPYPCSCGHSTCSLITWTMDCLPMSPSDISIRGDNPLDSSFFFPSHHSRNPSCCSDNERRCSRFLTVFHSSLQPPDSMAALASLPFLGNLFYVWNHK